MTLTMINDDGDDDVDLQVVAGGVFGIAHACAAAYLINHRHLLQTSDDRLDANGGQIWR